MFTKGNGGRPLSMRMGLGVGKCLACGIEFTKHDQAQVWCSPRCRNRGNNARWLSVAWKRRRLRKRQRMRAMEPGPVRDAILASKRRWNAANRERLREYLRAWRRARRKSYTVAQDPPGSVVGPGGSQVSGGPHEAVQRHVAGACGPGEE